MIPILPQKRKLPKLMACMTKQSLENMRNKVLFNIDFLDAKGIRRRKQPLCECLILELKESGYKESSHYLENLLYSNLQLVAEDDIGIVVDLRKRDDYLEDISAHLQIAEKEHDRGNTKKECLTFLELSRDYAEKGKGILWLAEKFYLASIAVGSQYLMDGGRLKSCCKYHYAKFLLDKFPFADLDEPYNILTEIRDASFGKGWLLYEPDEKKENPAITVFYSIAIELHRVLLFKSREVRKSDTAKSERLARLAERRAKDADDGPKTAEAIMEVGICQLMMNNLHNAMKTLERALKIQTQYDDINGLCETKMHMSAVKQKMGDIETAVHLLTEMGTIAMENKLVRHLGRALHLLGELHLRRERPELGTLHLLEAFECFIGKTKTIKTCSSIAMKPSSGSVGILDASDDDIDPLNFNIIFEDRQVVYLEESEHSRLMMAVSAGQELMANYFDQIRKSGICSVAKMKIIEWKLAKTKWWIHRAHHNYMPCMCPEHMRTPLDVLWIQIKEKEEAARSKVTNEEKDHCSTLTYMDRAKNKEFNELGQIVSVNPLIM